MADIYDGEIKEDGPVYRIDAKDSSIIKSPLDEVRPKKPNKDDDEDIDLEKIEYLCFYDNKKDNSVENKNSCDEIRGLVFKKETGVLEWKTDFFQSGEYEFKIIGSDGGKVYDETKKIYKDSIDEEIFFINVLNVNRPPFLADIPNQEVDENQSIKLVDATDNSVLQVNISEARKTLGVKLGKKDGDEDIDLQKIKYSCFYDSVADNSVKNLESCTKIEGLNFDKDKGLIDWVPGFDQAGIYEFKVKGIDDDPKPLFSEKIFKINVKNVNIAPKLVDIKDQKIRENEILPLINYFDQNTGDDLDIDKEKLSYKCVFDKKVDGSVELGEGTKECSELRGASFDKSKGELSWKTDYFLPVFMNLKLLGTMAGNIKMMKES